MKRNLLYTIGILLSLLIITGAPLDIVYSQETNEVNRVERSKSNIGTNTGTRNINISDSSNISEEDNAMKIFDLFLKGGIIMWPILILFAISLGFSIERYLIFRKAKIGKKQITLDLENAIKEKNISKIKTMCKETDHAMGRVIGRGIQSVDYGIERVEKSLSVAGSIEVSSLERGLNLISAIGNIAPMLGFLGTVYGMIKAFNSIAAADQISATLVAGGISVALFTTFAGLAVAIPTLLLYNYFVHQIDGFVSDIERLSSDIIISMVETSSAQD